MVVPEMLPSGSDSLSGDAFEDLRTIFLMRYRFGILKSLGTILGSPVTLSRSPLSREVKDRFVASVRASPSLSVAPAFHGTRSANFEGICQRGLLIPGSDTGVLCVNGS